MIFKHPKAKYFAYGIGGFILFLIVSAITFYCVVIFGFFGDIPSSKQLAKIQHDQASEVYSQDGVLLGRYFVENRTNVKFEELPKHIIEALIATEDARFYQHSGVDRQSLLRVLFKSILLGDASSGGGSTLSQQLAKNLFPRQTHGMFTMPVNKIKEAVTASRIEELYTKEEVLTLYFNTVPFGEDVYGIGVASERYFSCDTKDLTVPQAATLVGILKANTTYNPRLNPEKSKKRRNVVLSQMKKYDYLTEEECKKHQKSSFKIDYKRITKHDGLAPYFREYLRKELLTFLKNNPKPDGSIYDLYSDGLKIYTTIDSRLQIKAEKAAQHRIKYLQGQLRKQFKESPKKWNTVFKKIVIKSNIYQKLKDKKLSQNKINKIINKKVSMTIWHMGQEVDTLMSPKDSIIHYVSTLQTGLLSLEPQTGYVKVWVGGTAHKYFQYDHVTSPRQVGSTFKPIVYANALEQKISPCKFFKNQQKVYAEYDDWSPRNSGDKYEGFYTMKGALTNSMNTITAEMIINGGIDNVIKLAKNMEITANFPENPTIALGTASIPLFEMLGAYTVFANHGKYSKPIYVTKIEDKDRKQLFMIEEYHKQVINSTHAEMITEMLQSVVDSGTARRLRYRYKFKELIAGKTGTTQNNVDGWFIGYTSELLTGVWVGCDNPSIHFSSTKIGQGANTALPIWARYMYELGKDKSFKQQYFTSVSTNHLDNCPLYTKNLWSPLFSALVPKREEKRAHKKARVRRSSRSSSRRKKAPSLYQKMKKKYKRRRRRR